MAAFQIDEAALFFGRDALTAELWRRFRTLYETKATRLLTILGPSGSGRSSVARAGLLAELQTSPVPSSQPQPLRLIVLKPGEHPLRTLALALHPASDASAPPDRSVISAAYSPDYNYQINGISRYFTFLV